MRKIIYYLLIIGIISLFAQCRKKAITVFTKPPEELPLLTQEGKNTCGFLVNGKIWLPKGRRGDGASNLRAWYDPGYSNGTFNINGFRYDTNEGNEFSSFVVAIDNFNKIGKYHLNKEVGRVAKFLNFNTNCLYYNVDTIPDHNSFVNITKFDLQIRVIAGTFQFTLAKPGCDTIRITQGRFDIKL